jgi:hypothetical protein
MRHISTTRVGGAVIAVALLALSGCGGSGAKTDAVADEPAPPSGPAAVADPRGSPAVPADAGSAPQPSGTDGGGTARVLATGTFVNKDEHGSGMVSLVVGSDNAPYLRLESVSISSGPALHVFLTKEASPSTKSDVDKGFIDLGALRATTGNLTYTIPAATNLEAYQGVIVYCAEYNVVFTAAALAR